jgi:predicted Zn-ribbon and HTH transcriptional regulator
MPQRPREITVLAYHCLRCGADFRPRKTGYPARCGQCRKYNWDRPAMGPTGKPGRPEKKSELRLH